jgi:hypothetical protein
VEGRIFGAICEWASAPPAIAFVTESQGALRASSSAGNLPLPGTLTRRSKSSNRLQEASKSYQERS